MTPAADHCPPGVPDGNLPAGCRPRQAAAARWIDPKRAVCGLHAGAPLITTHTTALGQLVTRVASAVQEMPR